MRRWLALALVGAAACSSRPDELVIDCGISSGPEDWYRCEYLANKPGICDCMPRDVQGDALVCVPAGAGWGIAADKVIAEVGRPAAVVKCVQVGAPTGGGLPEPTIIVGASVGATGGDWPVNEPQADDCVCE